MRKQWKPGPFLRFSNGPGKEARTVWLTKSNFLGLPVCESGPRDYVFQCVTAFVYLMLHDITACDEISHALYADALWLLDCLKLVHKPRLGDFITRETPMSS